MAKKPKAHGSLRSKPKKHVKKHGGGTKKKTDSAMSTYFKKWDPQQALRGKDAQRELGAATRLEFDPQKRELARAMAGSDARQGQIDKWYQEYQGHVAQLNGQTAAAYGQANQQIGQFSQQQGQMDAANRANIESAGRADAALRGQEYSPQGELDATNAANARQQLLQAQQARVAGQGANQAAYGNNLSGAVQHEGVEQHTAEQGNRRMLESDARDLAKKEGDFRTDFLRQLREDERKYGIEKAAAKVDKFEARTDRKKAKETGRHNRAGESQAAKDERGRNARNTQDNKTTNFNKRKDRRAQNNQQGKKGRQDAASDARDLNKARVSNKGGSKGKGGKPRKLG